MLRAQRLVGHVQPTAQATAAPNPCSPPSGTLTDECFDFIIVGGGAAGCLLANRLSENPETSVLLLEAGGADSGSIKVRAPGAYDTLQRTDIDWHFATEPQAGFVNQRISYWPRGKTLGGSTAINNNLFVRGDPKNFDSWAKTCGPDWSYEAVLPYFQRLEDCRFDVDETVRGKGGPIHCSRAEDNPDHNIMSDRFVEAAAQVGVPTNADYNGRNPRGAAYFQLAVANGRRCSSDYGNLERNEAARRPNLTIRTHAHVTRVVVQGDTAVGVLYRTGKAQPNPGCTGKYTLHELRGESKDKFVRCGREVLLSAGAVQTPQLLLLSGIGPQQELSKHHIPMVKCLPGVGQNLQDHLICLALFEVLSGDCVTDDLLSLVSAGTRWLWGKTGPLSLPMTQATLFESTGLRPDLQGAMDLQIHYAIAGSGNMATKEHSIHDVFNLRDANKKCKSTDEQETSMWSDIASWPALTVCYAPTLLLPKSVGSISLRSADPLAYPVIQPNYFTDDDQYDVNVIVAGLKLARKIAGAPVHKGVLGPMVVDKSIPFPAHSDEYLEEYARRASSTVYHPVGTAKMGPASDPNTVVDVRLRVHGLNGLRVCDASIMPTITSGNTQVPVYMIAEKAADMIKADHGL